MLETMSYKEVVNVKKLRNFSIILFIASIPFLLKSYSLFHMVQDGWGIGIDFLGFEINDKVPFEQVSQYAAVFLLIGTVILLVSLVLFYKAREHKTA